MCGLRLSNKEVALFGGYGAY